MPDSSPPPSSDLPDPNLPDLTSFYLARAAKGDVAGKDWIVSRYSPALLMHARVRVSRHLRGVLDPEDLVQDVWLCVLPRLGDLRSRDGRMTPVLLKFMSTVTHNLYRNILRRHSNTRPHKVASVGSTNPGAATLSHSLIDPTCPDRQPLSWVAQREHTIQLMAAIDELTADEREIIVLRGIEQVSNGTVADHLGMKPNTVAQRYKRALDRLRSLIPGSVFDDVE